VGCERGQIQQPRLVVVFFEVLEPLKGAVLNERRGVTAVDHAHFSVVVDHRVVVPAEEREPPIEVLGIDRGVRLVVVADRPVEVLPRDRGGVTRLS
jgi:hypothetical protein